MTKEELRDKMYLDMVHLSNRLMCAEAVVQDLKLVLTRLKNKFDHLDRELAMENIIIVPIHKNRVKQPVKTFTLKEVQLLATKLGVELTIK